jgi:hypothetical protein
MNHFIVEIGGRGNRVNAGGLIDLNSQSLGICATCGNILRKCEAVKFLEMQNVELSLAVNHQRMVSKVGLFLV